MNNTLMIINILSVTYYTFTGIVFIFILLGISGKFGLFPLNLGIFGIVEHRHCVPIQTKFNDTPLATRFVLYFMEMNVLL